MQLALGVNWIRTYGCVCNVDILAVVVLSSAAFRDTAMPLRILSKLVTRAVSSRVRSHQREQAMSIVMLAMTRVLTLI